MEGGKKIMNEINFNCPVKNCQFYEECDYDNFKDCPTYLMCKARDEMRLEASDKDFYNWNAEMDIMEGEKINMSVSKEKIEKIKNIKIFDEEWDDSQFPYMSNKQIIEVHQYIYISLTKDVRKLRDGVSMGDFGVPILVNNLLIETKKRFKGE